MNNRVRQRSIYVSAKQKKKLVELIAKHPELVSCKVTHEFCYKDSHKLWQNISNECNSIPGAKKTWKQWRKTWQDIKCKTRKRLTEIDGEHSFKEQAFSVIDQEVIGIASITEKHINENEDSINISMENSEDDQASHHANSIEHQDSPPELKIFTSRLNKKAKFKNKVKRLTKDTNNSTVDWDVLTLQEQRKIQIKEDYLNFKKDYLKQKLKLLKEQTEALKLIAKEICK